MLTYLLFVLTKRFILKRDGTVVNEKKIYLWRTLIAQQQY